MLLWFVGPSMIIVWTVFRSPAVDYRLVAGGAALPVVEVVLGRPAVAHTLVFAAAVMAVTMAAYGGRRLAQRRALGIAIGLFLHLVLDGVFADRALLWWPLGGRTGFAAKPLPEVSRGWGSVGLELIGLVATVWWWRRWSLGEPGRRREFLRTGQVGRDLTA